MSAINNEIYHTLGDRWYTAQDDPIALLRKESEVKSSWILQSIAELTDSRPQTILDVGCGAGFVSNALALAEHKVSGIDLSEESLQVARRYDSTRTVTYEAANAYELPKESGQYDVVCSLDFLEHVEDPAKVIGEISRVLKPGGLFYFHTFNRNPLAWLLAIKGLEWFVSNTAKNMHVYELFIKPNELDLMCQQENLQVKEMVGLKPVISWAFFKLLFTGIVPKDFRFALTPSTQLSYMGVAIKGA